MQAVPKNFKLLSAVDEKMLRAAVNDFLAAEPRWITEAIARDPALSSKLRSDAEKEVLLYQGLHAIALHRKAHALYLEGKTVEARQLSQAARQITVGIEIHPGAKIGKHFFIDHGTGIVIGETAVIGDDVMLYHRITLGSDGRWNSVTERRHPKLGNRVTVNTGVEILGNSTIGDDVTVGAGTKIIGTVNVGKEAKIGPQLVIRKDVPEQAVIVGYNPLTFDLVFR